MIKISLNTQAIAKMAKRARGDAGKAIRAEVYALAEQVVAAARPRWPVDTGDSKRALTAVRGVISNRMSYTPYIRFAGTTTNVWRYLIVEPSRRLLASKRADIKRRYARVLRGR